jgi:hypothetical protein
MKNISVLQNLNTVFTQPYPHICIDDALPEDIYKELEETFPEELVCDTQPHDGGICYRYKSNPALVDNLIPNIWRDFFTYHTSKEYFTECINAFEPHIEKEYPDLLEKLYAGNVTVRDVDNTGNYVTDCQFVVHEPVDQTGTSRTPHIDNPVEIYAGLLYMRKPGDESKGGNFTIHETTGTITEVNKTLGRQVDDSLHHSVKQVPYKRNTFCMFLNVLGSVHSVTPRIGATERRRSINIIGEFNNTGRMWKIKEIKN